MVGSCAAAPDATVTRTAQAKTRANPQTRTMSPPFAVDVGLLDEPPDFAGS